MSNAFDAAFKEIDQSTDYEGMKSFGRGVASVVGPAILPTVGAVAGTGVLGPVAGPAVGGMLGEGANQLLGVTQPSLGQVALQGAVPGASGLFGAAKRMMGPFAGAKGAETLNRLAPQEIRLIGHEYQPAMPSKQLFQKIEGSKKNIPAPELRAAVKDELQSIGKSTPGFQASYGKLKKQLTGIQDTLQAKGGHIGIPEYQRLFQDVGAHIEAANRTGGIEKKAYNHVYSALKEVLESAPRRVTGPEADILGRARDASKREHVLDEIAHTATPFIKRGVGEAEQYNANKVLNRLKDEGDMLGKQFRQAFTPQEQSDILKRLTALNKIPAIPAGAGQSFGSGQFWQHTVPSLAAGGGIGYGAGGTLGAATGLAVGAALPPAARMARDFSIAWNTAVGRKMIQDAYRKAGKMTPEVWAAIGSFAASQAADPGAELYRMVGEK